MMAKGIQEVLAAVGRAAFQTFIQEKEEAHDFIMHDGELFRFKHESVRHIMTLWGTIPVRRRVYQNASDSKTSVAPQAPLLPGEVSGEA